MATATECKMSKQGWPLGTYRHPLGHFYTAYAETLHRKLVAKFGDLQFEFPSMAVDPRLCDCYATCRMSMETFGLIRAYIEGVRDGMNA